ncbi:hypothetical protein DXG03_006495 [Asterophora parasitica]|uniref:Uncharacterized protein n=1 Tax=Asterophora parasitica TaxID=117018 RepID=A0A9P7G8Q2_9AGAR|nr:hypothetical protein DXG03_006495 [Asterophora parasitica]
MGLGAGDGLEMVVRSPGDLEKEDTHKVRPLCPADCPLLTPTILDVRISAINVQPSKPDLFDCSTEDPESHELGQRTLRNCLTEPLPQLTRSRVLKDPFHIFNLFYISVAHGLRVNFALALRDAIFIPDEADKQRIIAWGATQNPPRTWNYMLCTNAKWLWKHCKHTIPPPEDLYPLVEQVCWTYGPLKDAKTGLPLFNVAAWGVSKNILQLIRKGYLSDTPGSTEALYSPIGVDAKAGGLTICCIRGTNFTEGGVHTKLRPRLPTSGVSAEHLERCLADFIVYHNIQVSTFDSTGKRYTSHYSIWLINELQEMSMFLHDIIPGTHPVTGWVNGNLYSCTKEVSGVLPIPKNVQVHSRMMEYQPELHAKQLHCFLASAQHTRKPVLPVHNQEEKNLFREVMSNQDKFGTKSGPNWEEIVRVWNGYATESNNISYKLMEHLKVYYSGGWETHANVVQSIHPMRIPGAAEAPLRLHSVETGFTTLPAALSLTAEPNSAATLLVRPPSEEMSQSANDTIRTLSCKRAADSTAEAKITKKPRQQRSCRKCTLKTECNGRKDVALCENPCKDCHKMD